jgi:hypothetical protein
MLLLHNYPGPTYKRQGTFFKHRMHFSSNSLDTEETVVLWHPFIVLNDWNSFCLFLIMGIKIGFSLSSLSLCICCLILLRKLASA